MKTKLHINIICDGEHFYNWIASTLEISSLSITVIKKIHLSEISNIERLNRYNQLCIIEGETYAKHSKKISQVLTSSHYEHPLLVVTDTYTESISENNKFNIIDTIVKPSLSIHTLEHAIRSLLKDYNLTQKLKKLAHYDALTGAANRHLFDDRIVEILKNSKRHKEPLSLLYFDLNGFKAVNDTYGHETGDSLLKAFVDKLTTIKRDADTLARLGGDEFCMLLPNTSAANLFTFVDRITHQFSKPFLLSTINLQIKFAIGGVTIKDQSVSLLTPKDILKIADNCVYEAKKEKETHFISKIL